MASPISFHASLLEKLLPGLTLENFENVTFSSVSQAVRTEIGCIGAGCT